MDTTQTVRGIGELNYEALIELAIILGQFNDYDETVRLIITKAKALLKADSARIMMVNPRTRQTVKTIFTQSKDADKTQQHFLHTNLSGWVLKNKRVFLSTHLQSDQRFEKKLFSQISYQSAICIPIKTEGILFGTILVSRTADKVSFDEKDLAYFEYFAAIVAPFLHNVQKMQSYFTTKIPDSNLIKKYQALGLLGKSKKFIELLKSIEAAARCDVRVLLEGPSGSGKERIVKAIHKSSQRSDKPFIAIDCGAIAANLIESELFGHVKGAFTGAQTNRKGLIEEAEGGTLFMDEISNLPLEMQAKLLRMLQEGEIRPLGSNITKPVNVRIITASSTPLEKLVHEHTFREDLFYRLHVFPIEVPSLNDRQEDIPLLVEHFVIQFAAGQHKQAEQFDEELIDFFRQRHWSGNIRELENLVERLVTLAPAATKIISSGNLPAAYKEEWLKINESTHTSGAIGSLNESLENLERQLILEALTQFDWNQSQAARALHISEQTIRYKMSKLEISKH